MSGGILRLATADRLQLVLTGARNRLPEVDDSQSPWLRISRSGPLGRARFSGNSVTETVTKLNMSRFANLAFNPMLPLFQ